MVCGKTFENHTNLFVSIDIESIATDFLATPK
jgi:hypothetical protein